MAEVIVHSLLLKLREPILVEAVKLYGLNDKVEQVTQQLSWTQSVLKDADSKRTSYSAVQRWVEDLREVSFLIEDAIYTYLLKAESLSEKVEINSFKNAVKSMAKKRKKFVALSNFDIAINKTQAILDKINENKERLGFIELRGTSYPTMRTVRTVLIPDDDIDLVGFDNEKKRVIELLLDHNTSKLFAVSIVGMGGLGKTALAEKIYQSIKDNFEFHIWLTVSEEISEEFNRINLLRRVLDKAQINKGDEEHCITKVKEFLTRNKYLIILDDVYSGDVWTEMKVALPDNGNMSRVLITTRNVEIAKLVDVKRVCELDFLSQEESIKLLFRKALPKRNFKEGFYPHDLREVATNSSNQCGGWPLALVEVGGQLSKKPLNPDAWKMVMVDCHKCTEIIATSYKNLPVYLKSCFMYFALFPEYHEYDAEFIACLWIAEEFIPHDRSGGLEEVAKNYLDELAQRCMIKVLRRSDLDGSVLTFRVHKLLHEFAIREAKETDFVKVLSKKDDSINKNTSVRRVAFQLNDSNWEESSSQENKKTKNINPNISTLLLFGMMLPFGSQFMMLRVLVIFHYNGGFQDKFPSLLVSTLKKLLLLRCLAFIGCNFPSEVVLPINHLQKLITLIIRSCQNIIVPSGDLLNLQTLKGVTIENPGIEFLNIPNVLELHLSNQYDSWKPIIALLAKLGKIETLTLEASKIPIEIIGTDVFRGFYALRTLYLNGVWQCNSVGPHMFPPFLTSLKLVNSQIGADLMLVLETLPCLTMLSLFGAYKGFQMTTSPVGFHGLLKLEISWIYGLKKWIIKKGAMPVLTDLKICNCNELEILPDLQYVTTLKVLTLRCMKKKFKLRLEKEDQHKIDHIPSIIIKDD